jgi:glycine betaine catabolism B
MHMLKAIDLFLNKTTMYRLVLHGLLCLMGLSFLGSFVGLISFSPLSLLVLFILTVPFSYLVNALFARFLQIPVHPESSAITGLILFLILYPPTSLEESVVVVVASVVAIASKYLLVWKGRLLFNPAAVGLIAIALIGRGEGIWWVGTPLLFPCVVVLAFLIVRKLERELLFLMCMIAALSVALLVGVMDGGLAGEIVYALVLAGPLVFFAGIMVTEPLTTPPTRMLQVVYGAIVGAISVTPFSIGPLGTSPEIALLIGNIFAFVVSNKGRYLATLSRIEEIAKGTYDIVCTIAQPAHFRPGQYAECTIPHAKPDSRGTRRYFTIASSPGIHELRFGIRFDPENASTFKRTLMHMKEGDRIAVGGISGAFTLPLDSSRKVLCIAGGIGITPFRSMIDSGMGQKQERDVVLIYANKSESEIAYRDLFERARAFGVRTEYILNEASPTWKGGVGYITSDYLQSSVPDLRERLVYVSGPHPMVVAIKKALKDAGVAHDAIKTDFFPGYT